MSLELVMGRGVRDFAPAEWDRCACPEAADGGPPLDPFTTHRFLATLEESGSVGPGTGWQPRMLSLREAGRPIAVAPLYVKSHSQGEYVFDQTWAEAYARAGGRYYPKLQIAVPFTPVTGRRLLTRPGTAARALPALIGGAVRLAGEGGLSSLHVSFATEAEVRAGARLGLIHRIGEQFHWHNRDYDDFDAFLAGLSARKRKAIRRERRIANGFGGDILALSGDAIGPEHIEAFWRFYRDTGARKWGRPYLTRAFFDLARARLAGDMLLILARRRGRWVAGALNFIGREALFGRWWGATERHSCLHFELCYYRAIDWAISRRLARVEAGAQGEHKLARGYLPVATHSLHWIADADFRRAVADYVAAEARVVDEDIAALTKMGPFRRAPDAGSD